MIYTSFKGDRRYYALADYAQLSCLSILAWRTVMEEATMATATPYRTPSLPHLSVYEAPTQPVQLLVIHVSHGRLLCSGQSNQRLFLSAVGSRNFSALAVDRDLLAAGVLASLGDVCVGF
jgi:hypothetical protein